MYNYYYSCVAEIIECYKKSNDIFAINILFLDRNLSEKCRFNPGQFNGVKCADLPWVEDFAPKSGIGFGCTDASRRILSKLQSMYFLFSTLFESYNNK